MTKLLCLLAFVQLGMLLLAPELGYSSSIAAGNGFTCALNYGRVKCWGENSWGQLGLGDTFPRGQNPGTMGTNLPFVDLGGDVLEIAVSNPRNAVTDYAAHVCARLVGGQVKCWGANTFGQLGQGHTSSLGDDLNEMGNSLLPINLGMNRTARQITLGESHTCALLDNGLAKCWGRNDYGQLGIGHTSHMGDNTNEMQTLITVKMDAAVSGRKIVEIRAGAVHTCARLDNGRICCWGSNEHNRISNQVSGNQLNQMTCLNMYGRTALKISLGSEHTCALLSYNGKNEVVCWGENTRKQTGSPDYYGSGSANPYTSNGWRKAVDLGTGYDNIPLAVIAGGCHTCAILSNMQIKCWGSNLFGEAGQANPSVGQFSATSPVGASASQMGNNLPYVSLGTGQNVIAVSLSRTSTCARLWNTFDVKCWGHSLRGQLGQGNMIHIGDSASDFGDNLSVVPINDCSILACGPHSHCTEYSPSTDMNCKCDSTYFYDLFSYRNDRSWLIDIITSSRRELNHCKKFGGGALLQVSNMGVTFKINMNVTPQVSVSIGLTNGQVNPALFGPPFQLPNNGPYQANLTYSYPLQANGSYQYNGQEFYFFAKVLPENKTIVDQRFVLPCGCDANTYLDFPPAFPRRDDGRPSNPLAVQHKGKIYPSWTDNSLCGSKFSLYRIIAGPALMDALNSQSFEESDLFGKSNLIQEFVQPDRNSQDAEVTSVVSDFVQEASSCHSRYDSVQFYDDVAQAGIGVGTKLFYCMIASDTSLHYSSGYSCVTDSVVLWEASMKVRVSAGKTSLPAVGVDVTWEARVPLNDTSEDGEVFMTGNGVTDRDGSISLHVVGDATMYSQLAEMKQIPVAFWFSKTSQISETEVIDHVFMCDGGVRTCTNEDPQIVELELFSFGEIVTYIEDATVIPFRGKVTLQGTELAEYDDGCPVPAVEICLRAPPANDEAYTYGCTYTDSFGTYGLSAPIGSVVVPKAKYNNHTFARSGPFAHQPSFKIRTQAIDGVDFKDTKTETLYVDVVGGLCNISIAENVTVTLTRNAEIGCSNWRRHHLLTKISPTRFSTTVPATYYEVRITPISEAGYPEGGVQAISPLVSYVVSDELDKPFRDGLIPLLEVNLTNIEGDFNETTDDYIIPRLTRFQYNPDVTMDLVLTQGELDDEVVGTPTSCPSAKIQVVGADYNRPVKFNMNFTQHFATGETCSIVEGVVKVQMNTWSKSTSEFVEHPFTFFEDPATNQTSHTSVIISAPMQPNPMPTPGSEYMRFITVEYSEGIGFPVQSFVSRFIVVGHYTDEESKFQSVPIVFDPIAIVRDPPGDGSYATYSNVESAVTYTSDVYELFQGMVSDTSTKVGPKGDIQSCGGLGVMLCKELLEMARTTSLKSKLKSPNRQQVSTSKNSFTRRLTWSFQTPGHSEMLPGPMSDMFLVPIEIVSFFDSFRISQNSSCAAQISPRIITFTLPQNNSAGIGWYSRYDITNRIIPNLELLLLEAEGEEIPYIGGALERWSQMTTDSPDILSDYDIFLFGVLGMYIKKNPELADVLGVAKDVTQNLPETILKAVEELKEHEGRRLTEDAVEHQRRLQDLVDDIPVSKWRYIGNMIGKRYSKFSQKVTEKSKKFNDYVSSKLPKTKVQAVKAFAKTLAVLGLVGSAIQVGYVISFADKTSKDFDKHRDEGLTEWDPLRSVFLKDEFHSLPSKPSLWSGEEEWEGKQLKAAESKVISFSGGGSQIKVELSDTFQGEKEVSSKHDIVGSLGLASDFKLELGPVVLEEQSNIGYEFEAHESLITGTVTSRITEASFVLSDSTVGDYFDVTVTRDKRYGTFAFNTTGGASRCPVEPNTASREKPKISFRPGDSGTAIVHPDAPAYFPFGNRELGSRS